MGLQPGMVAGKVSQPGVIFAIYFFLFTSSVQFGLVWFDYFFAGFWLVTSGFVSGSGSYKKGLKFILTVFLKIWFLINFLNVFELFEYINVKNNF
jgi:hypothetical protein